MRAIALVLGLMAASAAAYGCGMSYADQVKSDVERTVAEATVVISGRALSVDSQRDWVTARLKVDSVFKGSAPPILVLRVNRVRNLCNQLTPPDSGPFIAFLQFEHGNIQAPAHVGFVARAAMPADFAARLGKPKEPTVDASLSQLAPAYVKQGIQRKRGEVSEESWLVNLKYPSAADRAAKFYLRFENAVVYMDADYVAKELAKWPFPEMSKRVSAALPLSEATDLYKYALGTDVLYDVTERMDRLATEAVMEKRAMVRSVLSGYVSPVRVTRTSLGVQTLSVDPDIELQRSTWIPE